MFHCLPPQTHFQVQVWRSHTHKSPHPLKPWRNTFAAKPMQLAESGFKSLNCAGKSPQSRWAGESHHQVQPAMADKFLQVHAYTLPAGSKGRNSSSPTQAAGSSGEKLPCPQRQSRHGCRQAAPPRLSATPAASPNTPYHPCAAQCPPKQLRQSQTGQVLSYWRSLSLLQNTRYWHQEKIPTTKNETKPPRT